MVIGLKDDPATTDGCDRSGRMPTGRPGALDIALESDQLAGASNSGVRNRRLKEEEISARLARV
jgi:hypothetical protein